MYLLLSKSFLNLNRQTSTNEGKAMAMKNKEFRVSRSSSTALLYIPGNQTRSIHSYKMTKSTATAPAQFIRMWSMPKPMPSKQVYHQVCFLPWLQLHNSCLRTMLITSSWLMEVRPVGKTDNEWLRVRRRRGGLVYHIHGHSGDMMRIRMMGVDLISILGKTNWIEVSDRLSCESWFRPIYCLCCVCAKYFPFWFLIIKIVWKLIHYKVLALTDSWFVFLFCTRNSWHTLKFSTHLKIKRSKTRFWPSNASKKADQWEAFWIYFVDIPFICFSAQYLCCSVNNDGFPKPTSVLFSSTNKVCFT